MEGIEKLEAELKNQKVAFEGEVAQLKKLLEDMETTVLEQQDKIQVLETSEGGLVECSAGPIGTVTFTNNKGEAIGGLEDVPLDAIGLIVKMDAINLNGLDCKIVSRSMAVGSESNELHLTLKTSHASSARAVKDPNTRKWLPAGSKVSAKKPAKKVVKSEKDK